ncbi:hypothetical protein [Micavibrio aeruginosavorus]|uniref:hypothetical protein n=1 Tax=Micavibrio aeruginosavorus TaxID=349221 RepID=UPI003F4A9467
MRKIRIFFNDLIDEYRATKKRQQDFVTALKAVQDTCADDLAGVLNDAVLDAFQTSRLLDKIIQSDDAEMFEIALNAMIGGDVNYAVYLPHVDGPYDPYGTDFLPLLHCAIQNKANKIALRLATDKKTDVFLRPLGQATRFVDKVAQTEAKTWLMAHDLAARFNMRDVATILYDRAERETPVAKAPRPDMD